MYNLKNLTYEKKRIRNFIDSRLQSHFDEKLVNFKKRVRLEADLEKWRTDTVDMYNQSTGKEARWYSIYFDNEFICSFSADKSPGEVELLFLNNFTKLYEKDQIFLDENEYVIQEELRKAKEKEEKEKINQTISSAPSEVKQVIRELNETAK